MFRCAATSYEAQTHRYRYVTLENIDIIITMLRASDDANEQLPIRKCVYTDIDTTPRRKAALCTQPYALGPSLHFAKPGSTSPYCVRWLATQLFHKEAN